MTQEINHRKLILQYLLGELPEAALSAFEERFFADDELFAEIQMIESDLIDQFVHDKLQPAEHERFESHYLIAPERRQRVGFAKAQLKITESASASSASSKISEAAENELRPRSWWRRLWSLLKTG